MCRSPGRSALASYGVPPLAQRGAGTPAKTLGTASPPHARARTHTHARIGRRGSKGCQPPGTPRPASTAALVACGTPTPDPASPSEHPRFSPPLTSAPSRCRHGRAKSSACPPLPASRTRGWASSLDAVETGSSSSPGSGGGPQSRFREPWRWVTRLDRRTWKPRRCTRAPGPLLPLPAQGALFPDASWEV